MTSQADTDVTIRPVADDEWSVLAWLWQAFRQDLAPIVAGLPYSDGRYQAAELSKYPSPDHTGYLAWRQHPRSGEPAPIGFATVDGLIGPRRSITGFWIAPAARRDGLGRVLARHVLHNHPTPWTIAFQHDNVGAAVFWRRVADEVFGPHRWVETREPVRRNPDAPDDHLITADLTDG